MPTRLFNLRGVPDDEAEEIRALLAQHAVDFYETPAGNWGISSPALWLKDAGQKAIAQQLIDDYQQARSADAKARRQRLKESGEQRSIVDEMREHPLRFAGYIGFALVILYFSTKPFIDFGR